jgi:hypothetical protein
MIERIRDLPDWFKICLVDFFALMYAATTSVLTFSLFSHVLLELSLPFWIIYPVLGAVFICNFIMGFKKLANVFFTENKAEGQSQDQSKVSTHECIVLGMLMLYVSGFVGIEYLGAWVALGLYWPVSLSFAILGGICYYNLVLQLSIEGFEKIKATFSKSSDKNTSNYIDKIAQFSLITSVLGLIVTVVVLPVFSIWAPSWLLTTLGVLNLASLAWIAWQKYTPEHGQEKTWYSMNFITFYFDQVIDFSFLSIHALSESYVSGHGCYQTFGSHALTTCTVLINFIIEWSSDASGVLAGDEGEAVEEQQGGHSHGGSQYTQAIFHYVKQNLLASISIVAFSVLTYWMLLGMQVPMTAVIVGAIMAGYIQKQVCTLIDESNNNDHFVESFLTFAVVSILSYLLVTKNMLLVTFMGICAGQLWMWCSSIEHEYKEIYFSLLALVASTVGISLAHTSLLSPLMAVTTGVVLFSVAVGIFNYMTTGEKGNKGASNDANPLITGMALIAALGLSLNGAVEFQAVLQSPFYLVIVMGFIGCFIEFSVYSKNVSDFKWGWIKNPQASVDCDHQETSQQSAVSSQQSAVSSSQQSAVSSSQQSVM